jgi:hypothetical protein
LPQADASANNRIVLWYEFTANIDENYGRELGFAGQSFQAARLSIHYGLENESPEDVDFGLKVLREHVFSFI